MELETGGENMKLKDFSATKHFSMHFKRIFGGNTTFGDIAKVKQDSENHMGDHVTEYLKEQSDYINNPNKRSK